MTELINKEYAIHILKKAYPMQVGDWITFEISEALLVLGYVGGTLSTEVNEFIKKLE